MNTEEMAAMSVAEARLISIGVECAWERANDFLSQPANFTLWAEGLAETLRQEGERWIAQTPVGEATVRFTPRNEFGVLDHWIDFADGSTVYVPLRVVANGAGCEVTLTLFRLPGMSDEKFREDADWVERDLARLKLVLERGDV
jgi:hypothetical protein